MGVRLLSDYVDRFFQVDAAAFTQVLRDLESVLDRSAEPCRDAHYDRLVQAIHDVGHACLELETEIGGDLEQLAEVRKRYRETIAPWFDQSPLMHHAKTKPRGYPGDYEMLLTIYSRQPQAGGLGGYLDQYFLDTALGRAVPARMRCARDFLIEQVQQRTGPVKILNVACGPFQEHAVGNMFPTNRPVQVTCVDYDSAALAHVESLAGLRDTGQTDIRCVRYNALRLATPAPFQEQHGTFDVVYSIGLFDYIPDRYLVPMMSGLRQLLTETGTLYVAFKDMRRYDKTDYQWLVDWHFLQRTEEECRDLLVQAGVDGPSLKMTRDETGTIMNFVADMSRTSLLRVDTAHVDQQQPVSGFDTMPSSAD